MMIFGEILIIFGDIIDEFWRNWFVMRRRLRISVNQRTTKKMRFSGHCGLQTALEVKSDFIFKIYDPNYKCYHVCLGCFDLLLNFDRKNKEDNSRYFLT